MGIAIIRNKEINDALDIKYRQYLAGKLMYPQEEMDPIESDIEVGISDYKTFMAEKPHVHPIANEFNFVLEGELKIWLLDSGEKFSFKKGDFFRLEPGTPYASKSTGGTRVLFFKVPGGNDKKLVDVDEEVKNWLSEF